MANNYCVVCMCEGKFVCSGCEKAIYCSESCQREDWFNRGHKWACSASVGNPYTDKQRRLIYARGGHITDAGHARGPHGKQFAWPK